MKRTVAVVCSIASLIVLAACGGTQISAPVIARVSLSPSSSMLLPGQTVQFTYSGTSGGSQTTWSVNGIAGGTSTFGTIDSNGLYTAPAAPPSPALSTVGASSGSGSTQNAYATVTLLPTPQVLSLSPPAIFAGSADTQVAIIGTGFEPWTRASIGTTVLPTTYLSPTQLLTVIPASLVSSPTSITVSVTTTSSVGPATSSFPFVALTSGVVSNTANPLVAKYSVTVPANANVTVEFGPDTNYGLKTWALPTPPGGGEVEMLVAGMRTFSTYHMRAIVDYLNGAETIDADHTFATGGLPSTSLPNLTVTTPSELTPSSGVELLSLFYIGSTPDPAREAVACDLNGNVIWYYDYDQSLGVPEPIKLLANGNMMANILPVGSSGDGAPGLLREIDLAGNTVRELSVADLNTRLANAGYNLVVNAMHHDFAPLPNGHIILLTNHTENVSNVTGYTGTVTVVGDTLIDVDQNFNPVWVWDTFDHLDINRHPMGFPPDWTHGNGLVYLPDDGNLLFSMRHQHWVIKIDYEDGKGTGDILWRFGYQGDFTLASGAPPAFAYGQHDPSILSTTGVGVFKLGVFDNGNNRVLDDSGTICGTSSTPPCYSRVPIFDMDETTKTASVEWEDILNVFSGFVGSMQELPNGNIEFDIGAYSTSPVPRARIMEVTPDSLQQTVWQLDIYNQFAYRGLRMPSLYPGVQW